MQRGFTRLMETDGKNLFGVLNHVISGYNEMTVADDKAGS
jgi:hypothetical protein